MQGKTRAQFKRTRSLNDSTRQRILDRDHRLCVYCTYEATTVDHIVPYSFGGSDNDINLVACCSLCNNKLSNFVFDSFEQKKNYLIEQYGLNMKIRIKRALNGFFHKNKKCPTCVNCKWGFSLCGYIWL